MISKNYNIKIILDCRFKVQGFFLVAMKKPQLFKESQVLKEKNPKIQEMPDFTGFPGGV